MCTWEYGVTAAGYRAPLPVWSVQGTVAERRFYSHVVAEHVGLAVSYTAGFSLQFDGIKFQRLTVGLQLSSLEKPGLYEQTSKAGLNFTDVSTVFSLNTL